VTARVTLNGQALPVEPAWVVVAPPNYGPCRKSLRTMWDLMHDLAVIGKAQTSGHRQVLDPPWNGALGVVVSLEVAHGPLPKPRELQI
jgi:hypothetical protein